MKKEEILEYNRKNPANGWCIISDIPFTSNAAALKSMDEYAAQEVEKAKGGTCKWQHYTNDDFPECLPIGVPFIHSNSIELIYCPFCGKKIERV